MNTKVVKFNKEDTRILTGNHYLNPKFLYHGVDTHLHCPENFADRMKRRMEESGWTTYQKKHFDTTGLKEP
jgi:hypothetical protein